MIRRAAALVALMAVPAAAQDPLAPLPSAQVAPRPVPPPSPSIPVSLRLPASAPLPATRVSPVGLPELAATSAEPLPVATPQPQPLIVPRDWNETFAAIRSGQWAAAEAGIEALPPGPLSAVARAEIYTARGSPRVEAGKLIALLAEAPELPAAEQIARLAAGRGATALPPLPGRAPLVSLRSAPRRTRARPVEGEPAADALRLALDPLIKLDDAVQAEALLAGQQTLLSAEARAEAAQRVAWAYYVIGRDDDARRVADSGRSGAFGEWTSQAAWVSALASWRIRDFAAALASFREVAARSRDAELVAAGYYWAARSAMADRRPGEVAALLKAAARSEESFYGLLARETLGIGRTAAPRLPAVDTRRIEALANVQRALALKAIGETALAEEYLRHQACLGSAADHGALLALARKLDLPGTQYWLAHHGQRGARVALLDRYPAPGWLPRGGWRIDPALAFAHTLQESSFRTTVVSPAGAVGLMQVRPGTAGDIARSRGTGFSPASLTDPSSNLEYGQSFIEYLRDGQATRGALPKVIAAYNAGPLPVARWNATVRDEGDPLLWIESIPYWETRYYVPAVLRNLWVYQSAERPAPSLKAIAEHRWPGFPARRPLLASASGDARTVAR